MKYKKVFLLNVALLLLTLSSSSQSIDLKLIYGNWREEYSIYGKDTIKRETVLRINPNYSFVEITEWAHTTERGRIKIDSKKKTITFINVIQTVSYPDAVVPTKDLILKTKKPTVTIYKLNKDYLVLLIKKNSCPEVTDDSFIFYRRK